MPTLHILSSITIFSVGPTHVVSGLWKAALSSKVKASVLPEALCRSVPRTSSQPEHCEVMALQPQKIAVFFLSSVLVTVKYMKWLMQSYQWSRRDTSGAGTRVGPRPTWLSGVGSWCSWSRISRCCKTRVGARRCQSRVGAARWCLSRVGARWCLSRVGATRRCLSRVGTTRRCLSRVGPRIGCPWIASCPSRLVSPLTRPSLRVGVPRPREGIIKLERKI